MMITKQMTSVGYMIAKGGEGSGIHGHVTPPKNGSGGKNETSRRAFESLTLPLRRALKFDDHVVFLDKDDHVVGGIVAYGGQFVNPKTHIAVNTVEQGLVVVPREHLRMPKGGFRTRGE